METNCDANTIAFSNDFINNHRSIIVNNWTIDTHCYENGSY
jgi:hypothetical protein